MLWRALWERIFRISPSPLPDAYIYTHRHIYLPIYCIAAFSLYKILIHGKFRENGMELFAAFAGLAPARGGYPSRQRRLTIEQLEPLEILP